MRFLHPELAGWLAGSLVAFLGARWVWRRPSAASTTVRWLTAGEYRASAIRRLPLGFLFVALLFVAAALMRPVLPYSESRIEARGLDIVLALDLSSSMQEEMERVAPPRTLQTLTFTNRDTAAFRRAGKTRLEATKAALRDFVGRRRGDRLALVVFSNTAYVVSPLTFDHEYLLRYIDLLDDQALRGEGMTAIGDGLALANDLLYRQSKGLERRNQVVVLFTDGENNKGRDPAEVLEESSAAAIRVHFVGIHLDEELRRRPQVQQLIKSVRRFGGRYFNASTAGDLERASGTIDSVEKGSLVGKIYEHDTPVYEWFAVPALVCLVIAFILRAVPFFIDVS